MRDGVSTPALLHATDPVAARLEDLEFVLGEGPGRDAYRFGVPMIAPELTNPDAERRWPMFGREASTVGAAAVFAFPLQIGATPFGVLQLYRTKPGPFTDRQLTVVTLMATDGVAPILADIAGVDPTPTAQNPHPVFGSDELAMATGMITAQLQVPIDQALIELRAAAFSSNRAITDVAADVLTGRITMTPPDPAHE